MTSECTLSLLYCSKYSNPEDTEAGLRLRPAPAIQTEVNHNSHCALGRTRNSITRSHSLDTIYGLGPPPGHDIQRCYTIRVKVQQEGIVTRDD